MSFNKENIIKKKFNVKTKKSLKRNKKYKWHICKNRKILAYQATTPDQSETTILFFDQLEFSSALLHQSQGFIPRVILVRNKEIRKFLFLRISGQDKDVIFSFNFNNHITFIAII